MALVASQHAPHHRPSAASSCASHPPGFIGMLPRRMAHKAWKSVETRVCQQWARSARAAPNPPVTPGKLLTATVPPPSPSKQHQLKKKSSVGSSKRRAGRLLIYAAMFSEQAK